MRLVVAVVIRAALVQLVGASQARDVLARRAATEIPDRPPELAGAQRPELPDELRDGCLALGGDPVKKGARRKVTGHEPQGPGLRQGALPGAKSAVGEESQGPPEEVREDCRTQAAASVKEPSRKWLRQRGPFG